MKIHNTKIGVETSAVLEDGQHVILQKNVPAIVEEADNGDVYITFSGGKRQLAGTLENGQHVILPKPVSSLMEA